MSATGEGQMDLIDLHHMGRERVIGSWLVDDVIVDPGPTSCLQALLEGLGDVRPRALALTHIHLDHAGAAGALAQRFDDLEIWVHERGARHLSDPTKLIASAGRLYADQMQTLWGESLPVPAERIRVLGGGEQLGPFEVIYTPGHASHHVSYLHRGTGRLFGGDVTGVRIARDAPVLAPTPPPDIDLAAWRHSLDLIERCSPSGLICTHFGLYSDVAEHLAKLRACLDRFEQLIEEEHDRKSFLERLRAQIAAECTPDIAATYEHAMPPSQTFEGLERWRLTARRASS